MRDLHHHIANDDIFIYDYDGLGRIKFLGASHGGAPTSANVWSIKRYTYNLAGQPLFSDWANASPAYVFSWDRREDYDYPNVPINEGDVITQGWGSIFVITQGYENVNTFFGDGNIITQGMGTAFYMTQGYGLPGVPGNTQYIIQGLLTRKLILQGL